MNTFSRSIRALATAAAIGAALGACAGSPETSSTGELLDDSVITTKVRTALIADKTVSSLDINVETFRGRVLLSGHVKSPDERQRAEGLARSVGGVKEVNNKIEVR